MLVFRPRIQAVHTGQIDKDYFAILIHLRPAHALFDSNAGEIRNLLPETRKPVEQRGFAGVRRADNSHHVRAACLLPLWRSCNRAACTTVAVAHGLGGSDEGFEADFSIR